MILSDCSCWLGFVVLPKITANRKWLDTCSPVSYGHVIRVYLNDVLTSQLVVSRRSKARSDWLTNAYLITERRLTTRNAKRLNTKHRRIWYRRQALFERDFSVSAWRELSHSSWMSWNSHFIVWAEFNASPHQLLLRNESRSVIMSSQGSLISCSGHCVGSDLKLLIPTIRKPRSRPAASGRSNFQKAASDIRKM